MGNVIHRGTMFIEAKPLISSIKEYYGDTVVFFKTEQGWLAKDKNGKTWRNLPSHLRNEELYQFTRQYSKSWMRTYLTEVNEDYQTVWYEILDEAVETAIKEMKQINTFYDIYKYISQNLI